MSSKVRTPRHSNYRTESVSVRTAIELPEGTKSLKALAQRVLQASSTSNQTSNTRRTDQFEQAQFGASKTTPSSNRIQSQLDVDCVLEDACRGLVISPRELRQHLEAAGDMDDLVAGELTLEGLCLVAEFISSSTSPPQSEAERMLADNPEIAYAVTTGVPDSDGYEVIHLAIRNKGACTLRIPRDKYDGLKIMELLETASSPHDPAGGTRH